MPWSYAVTKLAHQRGVLVDAGTDGAGFPYGEKGPELDQPPSVHQEMALLVEHCGFTPLQAIEAATETGAAALGQSAKRGTVTPGKLADLVVLDADPSRDIHNTQRIAFVVKHGHIHGRQAGH
jgi:imidazolonepropionase-like amidohydrolase